MEKAKVLLWLGMMLYSLAAGAADTRIGSIIYQGNTVTQASVLDREIYIQPGDLLDERKVEKSRQAIMDLGLFRHVSYVIMGSATDKETVDVVFTVVEKYYLLILPRARADDNELHYGLQLRWDNAWGLNHNIRMLVEDRGDTSGIDENRNSLSYYYPNIQGTPYNIDIEWQSINEVDETDGLINRQDDEFGLALSRWLNPSGRNRGWLIGSRFKYQKRINEVLSGSQVSSQIDAVIFGMEVKYTSISDFEYNRGGKSYSYNLDVSDDRFGSDTDFSRHELVYRSYYRVSDNPLSNLNVQTILGHSNNDFLGEKAFSLGSSDDLRGYENDRFEGNTKLLTNIEYMFPHPGYPIVRYVYFVDLGNTYDAFEDILHKPLHVGVGFGLRWKIRSFVKLDLRADAGYGITDEDYHFTFGTRHAF